MFLARQIFSRNSSTLVPAHSDVVVVGGGAIGASTLYHLAKQGVKATLVERDKVTSGTTWHSAGLIWLLRNTDVDSAIIQRTVEMCRPGGELEQLTGDSCGYQQSGGLFLAVKERRMDEYRRLATLGRYMGVESQLLSAKETKELYPLMNVEDLCGSLFSPGDCHIDPTMYTHNLIKAAKLLGSTVVEMCPVTGIDTECIKNKKRVVGVDTELGYINTNKVVVCCGAWSPYLADMVGVPCPLITIKHTNVISGPIEGLEGMPTVRDHDLSFCGKVQGGGLLMSSFENNPERLEHDIVEKDLVFGLYETNWDVACFGVQQAIHRIPVVADTPISTDISGPESFTMDGKPLIGDYPGVTGFYLACGFNSAGLMNSGVGEEVAHYVTKGHFKKAMFAYSTARFHALQSTNKSYIFDKCHETYAFNYSSKYKYDESMAGRDLRKDPLHDILLAKGCVYQARLGIERPGWFSPGSHNTAKLPYDYYGAYGHTPHVDYGYKDLVRLDQTYQYPDHHGLIGQEVRNCITEGAVFNLSSYGKFVLSRSQTKALLDRICCTTVSDHTTTWLLNNSGGIEAQITIQPWADGCLVTTDTMSHMHVLAHIQAAMETTQLDCSVQDVTDDYGMLSVQGPNSKSAVESLSAVQGVVIEACSEVGLRGYHVITPANLLPFVYSTLHDNARLHDAGFRAYEALACEQGCLQWHSDIKPDTSPLEAGLYPQLRAKLEDPDAHFIGKEALLLERGTRKVLVKFSVESPAPLHTMETVYRNGAVCGVVCRAAYGYVSDTNIALCYVENVSGNVSEYVSSGCYEIENMGTRYPAVIVESTVVSAAE